MIKRSQAWARAVKIHRGYRLGEVNKVYAIYQQKVIKC